MRKTACLLIFLAAGVVFTPRLFAGSFTIQLKTTARTVPVDAEMRDARIMVDLLQAAEGLGAGVSVKDGEYVMEFSSGTATVNPQLGLYRVRRRGDRKWLAAGLQAPPYYSGPRLMVSLEDIPALAFRTFTYHLQKRELSENAGGDQNIPQNMRAITVRQQMSNRKRWVSLDDVAKALGVLLYSAQDRRYDLVMPDFTIVEVRVEDLWVYRNKERYKSMEDPVFLFSGVPYATPASLSTLFGVDMRWDANVGAFLVPLQYGRAVQAKPSERKPLTVIGYLPQPLRFSVDEMAAYYQAPGPTYVADQPQVYESVRDFLTNLPLHPDTHGLDRTGGDAVLNLGGSVLDRPLEGGGRFEKMGTRSRLVDGSLQWGFPGLQARASREFVRFGDLSGQFDLVDGISVSHANDAYGEGKTNPSWQVKGMYGQHHFLVFVSTDFLSQTVDFHQTMEGGSWEGSWKTSPGHTLSGSLSGYRFLNKVRQTSVDFNLFGDLFGEGFLLGVDPAQSQALTETALTDRHDTGMAEAGYQVDGLFKADAVRALSRYRDPVTGKPVYGGDWRTSATLGERRSRLTATFEHSDPQYRSIGSPTYYQDRDITRLSPYLDLTSVWKVYGEFRREEFHGHSQGSELTAYRNDSLYASNTFNFPRFSLRATANESDNSLYGKRWSGDLDDSHYIGRDALNVGGGWASQWFSNGILYRQSYTGRLGYQLIRPSRKWSAGQELTRHYYPFYKLDIYKNVSPQFPVRWQSSTHFLGQWGSWETFLQYSFEPRYYQEREMLYTAYGRIGYQVNQRKILNFFYATTALNRSLSSVQVWRAGLEYVNDFF